MGFGVGFDHNKTATWNRELQLRKERQINRSAVLMNIVLCMHLFLRAYILLLRAQIRAEAVPVYWFSNTNNLFFRCLNS